MTTGSLHVSLNFYVVNNYTQFYIQKIQHQNPENTKTFFNLGNIVHTTGAQFSRKVFLTDMFSKANQSGVHDLLQAMLVSRCSPVPVVSDKQHAIRRTMLRRTRPTMFRSIVASTGFTLHTNDTSQSAPLSNQEHATSCSSTASHSIKWDLGQTPLQNQKNYLCQLMT